MIWVLNFGSLSDWFSAVGTISAVFFALYKWHSDSAPKIQINVEQTIYAEGDKNPNNQVARIIVLNNSKVKNAIKIQGFKTSRVDEWIAIHPDLDESCYSYKSVDVGEVVSIETISIADIHNKLDSQYSSGEKITIKVNDVYNKSYRGDFTI